ncbi:DUF4157 domain-containing protein [Streptomyces sp. cmx-18-6]|uniref:eCIS core domain-containing protein n=1 Tax=Streptomyces sp. cmx-18-6 TaxID=2790930 RepID=UPI0039804896
MGNAAVARLLEETRHRHDDGCGHGEAGGEAGGEAVQRSAVHDVLRSPGRPLATPVRADMEARLGADFSDVRLHTGTAAQASATEIGARAYTSGHHVVIGKGGDDPHTLAHELTHVVQQRRGPVAGTDHGDGMRVSDPSDRFEREAEATATAVMRRPVQRAEETGNAEPTPTGRPQAATSTAGTGTAAATATATATAGTATGAPAIQRKGQEKLAGQVTPPPPKTGIASMFKKSKPSPVADIQRRLEAYDASSVRDPATCMGPLMEVQMAIYELSDTPAITQEEQTYLDRAGDVVRQELATLGEQVARDSGLPDPARPPYDTMTDEGALWNDAEFTERTDVFGMKGYGYFRELSELNRGDLSREIGGRADDAWVTTVTSALESELRDGILTHYTTAENYQAMVRGGNSLKSKTELDKADPDAHNNTSTYDTVALANHGFTFFFLEPAGSPIRDARFAKPDDPSKDSARIALKVSDTVMETEGWAMLSDFAQREYPTLKAHPERPAETESFLATREQKDSAKTLDVRKFDRAFPDEEQLMASVMAFQDVEDSGERQSRVRSRQDAVTDTQHRMVYGPADRAVKYPELLHSNVLVGSDIVKGLAQRAVVEIMRIEGINAELAERMKGMAPAELVRFLLKDLLRVQIMLPNETLLDKAQPDIYNAAEKFKKT